jgi:hypothetical protein
MGGALPIRAGARRAGAGSLVHQVQQPDRRGVPTENVIPRANGDTGMGHLEF